MAILVLMIVAYALGCCALATNQERHRKMIEGLGLPWGFQYAPEVLLAFCIAVAFVGGANL